MDETQWFSSMFLNQEIPDPGDGNPGLKDVTPLA
jgi:hypothetical protein